MRPVIGAGKALERENDKNVARKERRRASRENNPSLLVSQFNAALLVRCLSPFPLNCGANNANERTFDTNCCNLNKFRNSAILLSSVEKLKSCNTGASDVNGESFRPSFMSVGCALMRSSTGRGRLDMSEKEGGLGGSDRREEGNSASSYRLICN